MEDPSYHELPDQPEEERSQRQSGLCEARTVAKLCSLISVFLALVILVFFLWPRDPELEVVGLDFKGLNLNTTGGVHLDVDLRLEIQVENPNFFAVDYDRVTVRIYYHGDELGHVDSAGGSVPARRTVNLTANATLQGLEIVKNAMRLISDANKEKIPVSVAAGFDGNLEILAIHPSIKVAISCDLVVDPRNNTILSQECGNQHISLLVPASATSAPRNLQRVIPGFPDWAFITIAVVLGLLVLGGLAWLLWPKPPEITVESVQLLGFSTNSKFPDNSMIPEVVLDVNLGVNLRVRNRYVIGVRYDRMTVYVDYYGYEMCKGELEGGEIPARGSVEVSGTIDLRGAEIVYNSAQLLADVSRRELPIHLRIGFYGNVGASFFRPPIKASVNYDILVDPVSQEILKQDYELPKVSM
ncbi:uncharacterized protein LOC112345843 [Selaginella moellendorffii]|uniref:uncharacterized protein LOC112345843 n=1 Tax=Selaginella moellendorffii TaxID=88036 RepID=UPI000D1C5DBC|nr:uncharacterized protein LOC112345843 [Selaginella moellendorffii]|eukprot:XP_024529145.1 uncharacterized protein LOC112345843 [Selaginella moellendorffii]